MLFQIYIDSGDSTSRSTSVQYDMRQGMYHDHRHYGTVYYFCLLQY